MKSCHLFLPAIMALFFAEPVVTQAGPKAAIDKGEKVAALWTDGSYYVGTVMGEGNKKFQVLFEDGDQRWVGPEHVFALRADRKFEVGDRVLAAWNGPKMFPGVVTEVHPQSCRVKWDDGDTPIDVQKDRMVHKARK